MESGVYVGRHSWHYLPPRSTPLYDWPASKQERFIGPVGYLRPQYGSSINGSTTFQTSNLAGAFAASRQNIINKTLVSARPGECGWGRRGAFLPVLEKEDMPVSHGRGNCFSFGG
jgi:hypothetical protein